jgi:hypothetical protein
MRYMKNNALGYPSKCRIYGSIQQLLAPCVSTDAIAPPRAAGENVAISLVSNPAFQMRIFRQAKDLPDYWDSLLEQGCLPMSRTYLQAMEQGTPEGLDFAYLMFYRGGEAVGVAVCQLMEFQGLEHIQALQQPAQGSWMNRAWHVLKRRLASQIRIKIIVCGAAQFTGAYGFAFKVRALPVSKQGRVVAEAIDALAKHLKEQGWTASGVLIKDFYQEYQAALEPQFAARGYNACAFQPNMAMSLRPEWHSFEDYLEAMSSKYRVRARRAFKKAAPAHCVELDAEAIQQHLPALHQLYQEVADSSEFNLITLPSGYFLALKEAFPEEFRLFAYFHQQELIGFFTTLRNGTELEAHFMGFRAEENRQYQLYLNMLYEIVRLAIEEERVAHISFSRTAMEIKSSVGAEPKQAYCYIRHFSEPVNRLAPILTSYLAPQADWQQRHPFN